MKIFDIYIKNLRKFENFDISFPEKLIIKGPTGSGKTSILESCSLSVSGKSFRTPHIKEIIKNEKESLYLKCSVEDINGFKRELTFGADRPGNRKITVDGIVSSRKGLLDIMSSVTHSPEDMEIIDGVPSKRRDFLDKAAFIEDKEYYDVLVNYSKYIKQKSASLKKNNKKSVLYLNEAAVSTIDQIRKKRGYICEKINKKISETVKNIFPELVLEISSQEDENIFERLDSKMERELEKGYPLYGPHLDWVNVRYQIGESKNMSMGEKYFVSVILKLSEINLHSDGNIYPLFLMDDAFVFLDPVKKQLLLNTITELKNQIILTTSVEISDETGKISTYQFQ